MAEMLEFFDHSNKSHPSHLQTTKEVLELSIHLVFKIQEPHTGCYFAARRGILFFFCQKCSSLDNEAYSSLISLFSVICQDTLVKPNHLHNAAGPGGMMKANSILAFLSSTILRA